MQAIIFLITVIFAAGGIIYGHTRDISRLGNKSRDEERAAARRYHNQCMVQIASEDNREDRFKIAGMLKED